MTACGSDDVTTETKKKKHSTKSTAPSEGESDRPAPGADDPGIDTTVIDPNMEVEITFTHTMGVKLQSLLDCYIAEFNKIYPNIHITHRSAGGWSDISGQISIEIMGGKQPNIAYCYPDHVAMYNNAQVVVPLDDFISSTDLIGDSDEIVGLTQAQQDDLVDSFLAEGQVYGDGKTYTMPLSQGTQVLYYNKTFFDEHNLKVPTTWDEMWQVCAQINAIDPENYPLGIDEENTLFINMCRQQQTGYTSAKKGGQYLFNNAANKTFVKELRDYYQWGYFTTQELYGSYTSNLFVETQDQSCYMCIASSGGAQYQMSNGDTADGTFAFEVGVAPIPQYNPSNQATLSQGPNLCILKSPDTTDAQIMASWLFVKFLCTNVEFQAEFSMASGYMPVLESVAEHPVYASWLKSGNGYENLVAKTVQVCIEGFDHYFVPDAFHGSSTARQEVNDLMIKCLAGNVDGSIDAFINKAFQDAIDECEY